MVNFSDPEGYIDSSDDPPLPDGTFLHCTYTVTVYTGYGVELQVRRRQTTHTHSHCSDTPLLGSFGCEVFLCLSVATLRVQSDPRLNSAS